MSVVLYAFEWLAAACLCFIPVGLSLSVQRRHSLTNRAHFTWMMPWWQMISAVDIHPFSLDSESSALAF
jgi:hypothetical protein